MTPSLHTNKLMNKWFPILPLLLATQGLQTVASEASGVPPDAIYEQVLQSNASNNVQALSRILPEIEQMWPKHPATYVKCVNQAACLLGRASTNSDARRSLLNLFRSMMRKGCPTNAEEATVWVGTKRDTILYYLNFEEIRSDKERWIDIAGFIGEVRSAVIPNYGNKGFVNPPGVMDPSPRRVLEAIEQNERNKLTDKFQMGLRNANSILTFHLLHHCRRLASADPRRAEFIQRITSTARLTDDERRKLQ